MKINETESGWIRIRKDKAENLYADGKTVYVLPCNMRLGNMWQDIMPIPTNVNFNNFLNSFAYYNLDSERGKYPSFYVREEDYV